jgi:predicted O-linked N-acetylglucosamine transferase (SPINDLY family)
MAGSLLNALGLEELITTDAEEYEATAVALAQDPDRIADLRAGLQAAIVSTRLFDPERTARALERAYSALWHADPASRDPLKIDSE